eukprot:8516554-Ditylum_brightwellii.AAC.1
MSQAGTLELFGEGSLLGVDVKISEKILTLPIGMVVLPMEGATKGTKKVFYLVILERDAGKPALAHLYPKAHYGIKPSFPRKSAYRTIHELFTHL